MMNENYRKSGYLREDFRLFHNVDARKREIPFHYHDFHKLLIFLSGNVSYVIEGKQYALQPGDIVLVGAGQIHRPVIHDDSLYERLIFYISPGFFEREEELSELDVFSKLSAGNRSAHLETLGSGTGDGSTFPLAPVIRPVGEARAQTQRLFALLKEAAAGEEAFAGRLLEKLRLLELLIGLARIMRSGEAQTGTQVSANPLILAAMDYINAHLTDETLNIDAIAHAVSLGRSYLMHLFKAQMGFSIGQYITEKRLYMAGTLIDSGVPVTQASERCGFKNYAAFYHAWRRKYGKAGPEETPAASGLSSASAPSPKYADHRRRKLMETMETGTSGPVSWMREE